MKFNTNSNSMRTKTHLQTLVILALLFTFAMSGIIHAVDQVKLVQTEELQTIFEQLVGNDVEEVKQAKEAGLVEPYVYLEGKFPRERLLNEVDQEMVLFRQIGGIYPVALILLEEKRKENKLNDLEVLVMVRLCRVYHTERAVLLSQILKKGSGKVMDKSK